MRKRSKRIHSVVPAGSGVGCQDGCPLAVDRLDLDLDLVEVLLALALEQSQCQGLAAVERGGTVFYQRSPCG